MCSSDLRNKTTFGTLGRSEEWFLALWASKQHYFFGICKAKGLVHATLWAYRQRWMGSQMLQQRPLGRLRGTVPQTPRQRAMASLMRIQRLGKEGMLRVSRKEGVKNRQPLKCSRCLLRAKAKCGCMMIAREARKRHTRGRFRRRCGCGNGKVGEGRIHPGRLKKQRS